MVKPQDCIISRVGYGFDSFSDAVLCRTLRKSSRDHAGFGLGKPCTPLSKKHSVISKAMSEVVQLSAASASNTVFPKEVLVGQLGLSLIHI